MTLKYVDSVPEKISNRLIKRRLEYNKVMQLVVDFKNDHRKIALVECDRSERYASIDSFNASLRRAIRDLGYPIRVKVRGNDVYLVKD